MAKIESVTYTVNGAWAGNSSNHEGWDGYPVQVKFSVPFPTSPNSDSASDADVTAWDDLAQTVANWGLATGWREVDSIIKEVATTDQIQGLTTTAIPL